MTSVSIGLWKSERSDIPRYRAGQEWLRFSGDGDHIWETRQPNGVPWICRFVLKDEVVGYRLFPTTNGTQNAKEEGWLIHIRSVSDVEISVEHHGYTTVFSKCDGLETEPNKALY